MDKTTKYIIWLVVLVVVVWGSYALLNKPKTASGEVIRIGVVVSLTGPGAFHGENIKKGIDLAVDEINKGGGVLGKSLEVIYEDDQTTPKQIVSAAQKLISVDKVVALLGVQWDFLANAVIPVAEENNLAIISGSVKFDGILEAGQRSPIFFTTGTSVSANISSIKKFFSKESIRKAIIIVMNNDWGTAHINAYKKAANDLGVSIVEVFRLSQIDNNDFRTQMAQIKQMNPDAILLSLNQGDNINFTKLYREFGLRQEVLGNENLPDPFRAGQLNNAAALGFYFVELNDPEQGFIERFRNFYNEPPQVYADTAYDSIYVLKAAIEKSGGFDRESILRGIKKVNISGASGPINFTEKNYSDNRQSRLMKVTENGFEEVK